jgi:hypothetical protein
MPIKSYQINLIRSLRQQETASERHRTILMGGAVFCFGLLAVSLFYAALQVLTIRMALGSEIGQLNRIKAEYSKYKQTRMIVNKSDLELLDGIQNRRIFWTKKLAAMAVDLPDNYWITNFGYKPPRFTASGFGYISPKQEQLVTIDEYLNQLRKDSTYNDVFSNTFFNATVRSDEDKHERVSFEYYSLRKGK